MSGGDHKPHGPNCDGCIHLMFVDRATRATALLQVWEDRANQMEANSDDDGATALRVAEFDLRGALGNPALPSEPAPTTGRYRVGSHYGVHVYEGDRPVATFHDADEAVRFVAAMNGQPVPTVDAEVDDLRAEVKRLESALINSRTVAGDRIADRDKMLADIMRERDAAVDCADAAEKALADQREELATAIEGGCSTHGAAAGMWCWICDHAARIVRSHGAGA